MREAFPTRRLKNWASSTPRRKRYLCATDGRCGTRLTTTSQTRLFLKRSKQIRKFYPRISRICTRMSADPRLSAKISGFELLQTAVCGVAFARREPFDAYAVDEHIFGGFVIGARGRDDVLFDHCAPDVVGSAMEALTTYIQPLCEPRDLN